MRTGFRDARRERDVAAMAVGDEAEAARERDHRASTTSAIAGDEERRLRERRERP